MAMYGIIINGKLVKMRNLPNTNVARSWAKNKAKANNKVLMLIRMLQVIDKK